MPEDTTVANLLAYARRQLAPVSDSSRLDSEVLLAAALGKPRSYLYAWPEHQLEALVVDVFVDLIKDRMQGRPVAYLVGSKEFWSLSLKVSTDTLIPRPETELLVELAVPWISRQGEPTVLDLGTGSGAIALALATERANAAILAVDRSSRALAVARENASALGLWNVSFVASDWFAALPTALQADAIVANPPYVAAADPHLLRGDPRFEPRSALVAGDDGLRDLTAIIDAAPAYLKTGGALLLEHGYRQGRAVRRLLVGRGFAQVKTTSDACGLERVTRGLRSH